MANPGTQSNDDELCQELNKRTSLDWWQARGVWFGYNKEEYLDAVVLDGEAHYSDRPTDCYACIVRAQISAQTGSIAEICQYLEYKFPKGVEQ